MEEKGDKYRPLVYVCAPFSGDIGRNIKKAMQFAEFAYRRHMIPVTPHLLFPFLDDNNEQDRVDAMFMDTILLGKCQEVWVLGSEVTEGMAKELDIAKRRRQRVRYFTDNFKEVV